MQAKALRSAVDSGLEVPPEVIDLAIRSVREHYTPAGLPAQRRRRRSRRSIPGQFTYTKGGGNATHGHGRGRRGLPAGVRPVRRLADREEHGGDRRGDPRAVPKPEQAATGRRSTPTRCTTSARRCTRSAASTGRRAIRCCATAWWPRQVRAPASRTPTACGRPDGRVGGKPGELYMTAVACFILAMPNRYLPILQEGKIDSLRQQFQQKRRSDSPAHGQVESMRLAMPFLAPWFADRRAGRRRRAGRDPPAQPPALPRGRVGGDGFPARGRCSAAAGSCSCATCCCWPCGCSAWSLFGAALARPYLHASAAAIGRPDQPVHAVLLVDNSLSMGYQKLDGTLLDEAKAQGQGDDRAAAAAAAGSRCCRPAARRPECQLRRLFHAARTPLEAAGRDRAGRSRDPARPRPSTWPWRPAAACRRCPPSRSSW